MRRHKQFLLWVLLATIASIVLFVGIDFGLKDGRYLGAQIPISKRQRIFYYYKLKNVEKVRWAGHQFERAVLDTNEYNTSGNKSVKFTDSGYYAPSYSLPRSKLLDVNMNEKGKVTIQGVLEGELKTLGRFNFSEFAVYLMDEDGNARGLRQLGSKHNAKGSNVPNFKFTEFTVENTGQDIVMTDSSGFSLSYSKDFKYVTSDNHTEENRGGNYGELDPKQKWFLEINCHVNGKGFCRMDIQNVVVEQ